MAKETKTRQASRLSLVSQNGKSVLLLERYGRKALLVGIEDPDFREAAWVYLTPDKVSGLWQWLESWVKHSTR